MSMAAVRRALAIAAVVMSVALAASGQAAAAEDEATVEIKARTYFASGEFKQALEIYARLYVETMHPTYLRNIGRCHQNLGDPDKAIASFREYLRKAKDLSPDQRAEIDGYIAEMEQLKRSNAARASTAPPAPAATDAPAVLVGPPAVAGSPARDAESGAFYTSPWFWVGVAVVVGGAVTAAVLLSADRSPTHGGLGVVDFRDLP